MRNAVLFLALLTLLAGCNTASNMAREVSSWVRPDKKGTVVATRQTDQAESSVEEAPTPVAAPRDVVTSEALATPHARAAKIALLLPLSGKDANLGKSFLDAAQMAVLDLGGDGFDLMPRDAGENAASAEKAAEEAMANGASLIIGPVFSTAVAPVKMVAAKKNVPVLALSNDESAAGGGAYILGFRPAEQVVRVAEYAASKGIKNIAVLAPVSAYGTLAVKALKDDSAVNVELVQNYQANKESIRNAVAAVLAHRADIQGIFIADGGLGLSAVAGALHDAGISAKDLPLLGTGLWDDGKLAGLPALYGGWFAAPEPTPARAAFAARFQKNYGYKPVRLASLAYDATALAAVLAKQGAAYDDAALTSGKGFAGLDGIFRLNSNGMADHGLAIMEVTPNGAQVLESAAKKF